MTDNEKPTSDKKSSFWSTLPGILTAISGFIVAITGLMSALGVNDLFGKKETPIPIPSATIEISQNTQAPSPEPTDIPTNTVAPTATVEVVLPTETPTATATLAHHTIPDKPKNPAWFLDASSRVYANEGEATADDFLHLLLERPFTAQSMDYAGHVDINRIEISDSKDFVYVSIFVEETPPEDAVVFYGVELDLDLDGRGDWLVYGLVPHSTEWTVEGVQVYTDSDNNVGGPSPIIANDGVSGNGYETLVFNAGRETDDPDMAWIRRSPDSGNEIQIAFKLSMIDFDDKFLWNAWADAGPMQPEWFDYNDYFTSEDAGSPIRVSGNYPLNLLAMVDNTCRRPYGFTPNGSEPGLCP